MGEIDALFDHAFPQTLWLVGWGEAFDEACREVVHRALCIEGTACGRCPSCRMWDGDRHPDLIDPAAEAKSFDIAMARQGRHDLALLPVAAPRRLLWVRRADELLTPVANSLLKVAEEPPAQGALLFTSQSFNLLPTLRSRSWLVAFPREEEPCEPLPSADELDVRWAQWSSLDAEAWAKKARALAQGAQAEGRTDLAATLSQLAHEGLAAHLSATMWADLIYLLLREDYPLEYLFDPLRQASIFGRRSVN